MKNSPAFEPAAIDRVCAAFVERGETVADWARAHGFEPPQVYAVLAGRNKGRFGRGHAIAVALGLKAEAARVQTRLGETEAGQTQPSVKSSPPAGENDFSKVVPPSGGTAISERRHA